MHLLHRARRAGKISHRRFVKRVVDVTTHLPHSESAPQETPPPAPAPAPRSAHAAHGSGWILKALLAAGMTIAVAGMMLVLAGVFKPKTADEPAAAVERPYAGQPTAEVRLVRRQRFESAVGTIRPVHESSVASKLLARVVEVRVQAGQVVTQDDVLVRLDDAELQARLEQALAAVAVSRAASEKAVADFNRAERLRPSQAITQAAYDQAAAALKSSQAEVQRAEQAHREAEVLLGFATITAPISGTIVDKRVEQGDTVTPGQVLLTLYDPARMQMVATVRESLAQQLVVGQRLPARVESMGYECLATVSEVVPEAQAASRSFTVKVTGPCPPGVYSGMFGRLLLPLDDEQVLLLPVGAVRRVGQLTLVDVVVDENVQGGHVQRRHVQLGRQLEGDIEVLSGLRAGERVMLPAASGSEGRPHGV